MNSVDFQITAHIYSLSRISSTPNQSNTLTLWNRAISSHMKLMPNTFPPHPVTNQLIQTQAYSTTHIQHLPQHSTAQPWPAHIPTLIDNKSAMQYSLTYPTQPAFPPQRFHQPPFKALLQAPTLHVVPQSWTSGASTSQSRMCSITPRLHGTGG
jgi:hypothetical protein